MELCAMTTSALMMLLSPAHSLDSQAMVGLLTLAAVLIRYIGILVCALFRRCNCTAYWIF